MPSTNGHGPKAAILCARVSTDEQARPGYSPAQQIEAGLYRATPGAWLHLRDRRASTETKVAAAKGRR
jgi:hypothetical protein